jgi:hypothetical protein
MLLKTLTVEIWWWERYRHMAGARSVANADMLSIALTLTIQKGSKYSYEFDL